MDASRLKTDCLALLLFAGTLWVGLALASADPGDPPARQVHPANSEVVNLAGPAGAWTAWGITITLGVAGWLVVVAGGVSTARLLARPTEVRLVQRTIGWSLLIAAAAATVQIEAPGLAGGAIVGSGGLVGSHLGRWAGQQFTPAGVHLLLVASGLAGLVLAGEWKSLVGIVRMTLLPLRWLTLAVFGTDADRAADADAVSDRPVRGAAAGPVEPAVLPGDDDRDGAVPPENDPPAVRAPRSPVRVNPPVVSPPVVSPPVELEVVRELLDVESREAAEVHHLPPLSLLDDAEEVPYELLARKAQLAADTLEKTFAEFGLNVRVVEIDTGPVITQFELELEAGLRLSKVSRLADDLAIALRAPSVRVVAPIPGRNTVGIEVPNETQVMVRLRELLESCPVDADDRRLPVFLGKDVSGRPLVIDLARLPHLLVAGRTGTGKSVALNALILSLLMTRTAEEVKLLMIDPKMVELSPFSQVPHLMHPVITDMKKAEAVLAWAVDKMEERYQLLARCRVRHLESFNRLSRDEVLDRLDLDAGDEEAESVPERMPYIVIVADEMADLMMIAGKEVEHHIIRLAQKSRAVGIHLVLATQKPTVDVITGLIKSNLPARISFQVASRTDSRVVLDEMGADKLLGNGDMLYLSAGTSHLVRAQGTFVSDEEINKVIDFFADRVPDYSEELVQLSAAEATGAAAAGLDRSRDDLYDQAIEVVIREGRGSVSLLQRCLGIGYGRAARLVDYMAEDGIVGDYNGSQAREVLYTSDEWDAKQFGAAAETLVP